MYNVYVLFCHHKSSLVRHLKKQITCISCAFTHLCISHDSLVIDLWGTPKQRKPWKLLRNYTNGQYMEQKSLLIYQEIPNPELKKVGMIYITHSIKAFVFNKDIQKSFPKVPFYYCISMGILSPYLTPSNTAYNNNMVKQW